MLESHGRQSAQEISAYYSDADSAIREWFSKSSGDYQARYVAFTPAEIEVQLRRRIAELEASCVLMLLAELEAIFRRDFSSRVENRKRDPLSRHFRSLARRKSGRTSWDQDLLEAWILHHSEFSTLAKDVKNALKLRNWLAHGRYWLPKFGKRYDFIAVRLLIETVQNTFPFCK